MSRPTQDTDIIQVYFVYEAITPIAQLSNWFYYKLKQMFQSYNPKIAETILVWANSISLAATPEITIVFFSCAYVDVSVQRVSVFRQYIFNILGFPIRKSTSQ